MRPEVGFNRALTVASKGAYLGKEQVERGTRDGRIVPGCTAMMIVRRWQADEKVADIPG